MKLSILQLNIWGGMCFPPLREFLEKSDFDILCFQEVSGKDTHQGSLHVSIDCYHELSTILGATHEGELAISQYTSSNPQTAYFGNAIFYKKGLSLLNKEIFWLYERTSPFPSDATSFEEVGRNVLRLTLTKADKHIEVLTTHLAWGPTQIERPHQTVQNKKLFSYLTTIPSPWVLTGDFNLDPNQPSILALETLGRDLTKEYAIPNTVDPKVHVAWEKIKPGFSIDYIFVSKDIQVDTFRALTDVHVSDHIGLRAEIEI